MLIYTEKITPRLHYIAEVFFGQYRITTAAVEFHEATTPKINYSFKRFSDNEFHISPAGLLGEGNIRRQDISITQWDGLEIFFTTKGDIPFDIFSASFYLLSRYEEYLPHQKDSYGRFAHNESLAYRSGFLSRPLVNLWMQRFFQLLEERFPVYAAPERKFNFVPTYDIDIAFAGGRGWLRKMVSLVKRQRTTINGRDIFDVYDWLRQLHDPHHLSPVYFFLLAKRRSRYDKNVSPRSRQLRQLIRNLSADHSTGIHPSWLSHDDEGALVEEIACLEKITGHKVTRSRQHYVRFTLPHTYHQLIDAGITEDHSMGYGSINGFRASYTAPFYWYDLMREERTGLLLHPFCYMDANAYFEERLSLEAAANELDYYYETVKNVQGQMVTIFHNHFLTEEPQWIAWRRMYQSFIEDKFPSVQKV